MSKRFTETQKWEDPWFRRLEPRLKLLWFWILDRCDSAGIIDPDIELASFQIGYPYPMDTLSEFPDRIITLPNGKLFIPKFIAFQYGKLSTDCRAHGPIFQALSRNEIDPETLRPIGYPIGYPKGMDTLQVQDKVQDKEKYKDKNKTKTRARVGLSDVLEFAESIALPQSDGEWAYHKWEGNGWTNGGKPIRDWRATIRSWRAAGYLPSQKSISPKPHRQNGYHENLELP